MKKVFFILALVLGIVVGVEFIIPPIPSEPSQEQIVETEAFMAVLIEEKALWAITLNPKYYISTQAVALEYNNTEYGVFLVSDIIYLPVIALPTELHIAPLDVNGNPLASETFIFGVEHATKSHLPEKP